MAQVIADSNGNILRFTANYLEDDLNSDLPLTDFPNRVWFDEVTNPLLIKDIFETTSLYRIDNGILQKDGFPVVIAQPGQDALDRQILSTSIITKLDPGNADLITSDELKAIIRLGLNRVK